MVASAFDTLNARPGAAGSGGSERHAVTEGIATKGDILRVDNDVNTGSASLNDKIDSLAAETRADALAKDTKADIVRLEIGMTTIVVAGLFISAIKCL